MAAVELDPKKAQSVNLGKIDPGDIEQLMIDTEEEVIEEAKQEDATLTLAALGGAYKIGPIEISVALGNLVLLNQIDSPFITGEIGEEGDKLDTMDCFKAIYVLAKGKEAIKPIMAVKQRIQNLLMLEKMATGKPELFESLMDRVETISEADVKFEEDARDFYHENFVGHDFQEVVNSVFAAFTDVMKTSEDLPTDGPNVEKKKQSPMTTTGP